MGTPHTALVSWWDRDPLSKGVGCCGDGDRVVSRADTPHGLSQSAPPFCRPTELVCNRTFDKFSCWPDALPNTTVNVSCPWFLPWYQKGNGRAQGGMAERGRAVHACTPPCGCTLLRVLLRVPWAGVQSPAVYPCLQLPHHPPPHAVKHRYVFKTCGPDGQWVTGPKGQSLRDATQCQIDAEDLEAQVGSRQGAAREVWCSPCPVLFCPIPRPHCTPHSPGEICQDLRQLQSDVHCGLLSVPMCAAARPGCAAGLQVGTDGGCTRGPCRSEH